MNKRQFTPYEFAQLAKYKFDALELSKFVDENIPVEYITGYTEFRGSDFQVNQHTLIPRIETEEIIDHSVEILKHDFPQKKFVSFADIGTGSGAIGISFAKELLKHNISFEGYLSDLSKEAIEVAKKNIDQILDPQYQNCFTNKVLNSQLKVIQSDLLKDYPKNKEFDFIFANLPYIPSLRIQTLDKSVKDFEPVSALDGGNDGLELVRKLLQQAPEYLKEDGVILLEVDDSHNNASEFENDWDIKILKDQLGNNRFWILKFKYTSP